jgi:hypothetical protein
MAPIGKSKKASSRVTASEQESAAAMSESQTAIRRIAIRSNARRSAAARQSNQTQAKAIQGHMRASGQRRQAKRDAR